VVEVVVKQVEVGDVADPVVSPFGAIGISAGVYPILGHLMILTRTPDLFNARFA